MHIGNLGGRVVGLTTRDRHELPDHVRGAAVILTPSATSAVLAGEAGSTEDPAGSTGRTWPCRDGEVPVSHISGTGPMRHRWAARIREEP